MSRSDVFRDPPVHEHVRVLSFPDFLYTWPLIAEGYAFALVQTVGINVSDNNVAMVFGFTLTVVLLAIGIPMNFLHTLAVSVFLGLFYVALPYLSSFTQLLLGGYGTVSTSFVLGIANVLALLFACMYFYARINYYTVHDSVINHHKFGRSDDSQPRAGKRLLAEYPSFLKSVLGFGAGDLVLRDYAGTNDVLRIRNVPLLWFRFAEIEQKLRRSSTHLDQVPGQQDHLWHDYTA